ncbi:hypothetical protein [Ruegeria jejuensis]|uniref:hypothetical protein n=1 Tax=Ruegeria jejuensis TaxID=3233338 RepID=UPI00355BC10A
MSGGHVLGIGSKESLEEKISRLDNYQLTDKGYLLFTILHIVDDIDADAFVFNNERAEDSAATEQSAKHDTSLEVNALAGTIGQTSVGSLASASLQHAEDVVEHIDFEDVLFEPETYENIL